MEQEESVVETAGMQRTTCQNVETEDRLDGKELDGEAPYEAS